MIKTTKLKTYVKTTKLKTYVKIDFDNVQKIMENVIALTYRDIKKTDKFELLDEVMNIIFNSIRMLM